MLTSECHMNIAYVCCLVAIAIQLLSLVIPGWLIVTFHGNNSSITENHGVLLISMCTQDMYNDTITPECVVESYLTLKSKRFEYKEVFNGSHAEGIGITLTSILEWEMEVVCGFIVLVVSLFLLIRLRTFNKMALVSTTPGIKEPSVVMYVVNIACLWTSYILYLIAILWIVQLTMSLSKKSSSHHIEIDFPYGLFIPGLGTLLTLGSLFSLFTVLLCPCVRRKANRTMQCQGQDMELEPIQSQAVPQAECDNTLPPPYVYMPQSVGNQQQIDPKPGHANSEQQAEPSEEGELATETLIVKLPSDGCQTLADI